MTLNSLIVKTFRDIYKFPLYDQYVDDDFRSRRIVDQHDNFVFQFEKISENDQIKILDIINETFKHKDSIDVHYEQRTQKIKIGEKPLITIRGWGNLTGSGGHNLSQQEAANIQNTFAEYIVNKLNKTL